MSEEDRQKWDARYANAQEKPPEPPAWLAELQGELPDGGSALDLAAGTGRLALWMARKGLAVTAADISKVGLERLRHAAAAERLAVTTECIDLQTETLPRGLFDLITVFFYWQPGLIARMSARLVSEGVLIAELPTLRNLERHDRPSRRFLLEPNQLLDEARGLEIFYYREGWREATPGSAATHTARLAARRPSRRALRTLT